VNRLQAILAENSILEDGQIQKTSEEVTFKDNKEISNLVRYISNNHGTESLQPWFEQDLSNLTEQSGDSTVNISSYRKPRQITELMGVNYVNRWDSKEGWEAVQSEESGTAYQDFYADLNGNLNVKGVNWIIQDAYWEPESDPQRYDITDGRTVVVESQKEEPYIRIFVSGNEQEALSFNITPVIKQFRNTNAEINRSIPLDDMMLKRSKSGFSAVLYLNTITWNTKTDSSGLVSARFNIGVE
jgi:hypothetical protein